MEYQQLQDEIKAAMKARDNHRRDILRQVHTELKACLLYTSRCV